MEPEQEQEGGESPQIYHMSMEDIQRIIEEHLPVKKEKKDEKGEVMTPFFLIEDMLDRLPRSIWKNPRLKWLEPSSGIGGFPMVIYMRLMINLPETYSGEGISYSTKYGKSQHILKKMLHMVEIDKENIDFSRKIFGKDANLYHTDFLKNDDSILNTMTFHVIVGNPPYNQGGTMKGGGILWKDFVFKSLEILAPDGYLSFVHPTGWRKPATDRPSTGDIWTHFRKYHLRFLKMTDENIPHFPRVDYYVLQKSPVTKQNKTHVISIFQGNNFEGDLELYDLDFIPHFVNPHILRIFKKLFAKSGDKFHIQRDRSFEPTTANTDITHHGLPYTFYYEPECRDYIYAYKKTSGSESLPDYIHRRKIIMTHNRGKREGSLYPVYYSNKNPIGSSSNTMYQIIEKGDNVKSMMILLKSRLIEFLMRITQYSETPNHKNEYKILNRIAKPKGIKTDADVYTYYGIHKSEIHRIDRILGDIRPPVKSRKIHCRISRNFTSKAFSRG